jgi:transcriptional regulator with XRE-family HTH domain
VDDLRPAFGRRVRALRQKRGLSQEQLAERADLHWTYISGIERGRRNPGLNILGRLACALDVPLPKLVSNLKPE